VYADRSYAFHSVCVTGCLSIQRPVLRRRRATLLHRTILSSAPVVRARLDGPMRVLSIVPNVLLARSVLHMALPVRCVQREPLSGWQDRPFVPHALPVHSLQTATRPRVRRAPPPVALVPPPARVQLGSTQLVLQRVRPVHLAVGPHLAHSLFLSVMRHVLPTMR